MQEHNEYREIRLKKLQDLKARGEDPFAIEKFDRTHTLDAAKTAFEQWGSSSPAEDAQKVEATIAGRIVAIRQMGKASFITLEDLSGRLQLYLRKNELPDLDYEHWDMSDILGVSGFLFRTRTGEVTLHTQKAELLALAVRPLPYGKTDVDGNVHYGLSDKEQRYRQRYADLNVNLDARDALIKRSQIVSTVRRRLDELGFLEVETPVLQMVAGGAAARPFKTHHNALDIDLKLRISLELPLKRLIVGGLEKVYEIGRVFRNEGISVRHNPEFTMMELYQAYVNLEDIMAIVEDLFRTAAKTVLGSAVLTRGENSVDLEKPWARLSMLDGIKQYANIDVDAFQSLESAKTAMRGVGLPTEKEDTVGGIMEKLLERFIQPNLIQPTFITDYPIETSPLAKRNPNDPALTRRFEAYMFGQELGNAFSEINDPIDQRERFESQVKMRAGGDEEAHPMDEDYLRALEYGMPPCGGLGLGMDRMAMTLLGVDSVRDVIFFPLLKPE